MYEGNAGKNPLLHAYSTVDVDVCVCDERPKAISASTAKQSFGSRSECESHKADRRAAREDTALVKPHLDTFLTVHFTQRQRQTARESPAQTGSVCLIFSIYIYISAHIFTGNLKVRSKLFTVILTILYVLNVFFFMQR